jgi:hypothetical protein
MPDPVCTDRQARLVEALLAHAEPDRTDLDHARTCAACAASLSSLRDLRRDLDAWTPVEPPPALVSGTWRRLREALAVPAPAPSRELPRGLPVGFRRELARLLSVALAPLPLVLLWNVGLVLAAERLLSGLVPSPLLGLLGFAYAAAAAGWLALLYGSLPFLAHGRAQRRLREVPS